MHSGGEGEEEAPEVASSLMELRSLPRREKSE